MRKKEKMVRNGNLEKKVSKKKVLEKKVSVKKAPKKREKKEHNKKSHGLSMKAQLLIGFIVPVCIVVFIGLYSYKKASQGMLVNYEKSTMNAISMATELLNYGFESVQSDSAQIYNDTDAKGYVTFKKESLDTSIMSMKSNTQNLLVTKQTLNKFISNIHIITSSDAKFLTTHYTTSSEGFFDEMFAENSESYSNVKNCWIGEHSLLDSKLGVKKESYSISLVRMMPTKNAFVVVDVNTDKIAEILKALDLGEGSIVSFVTEDGRQMNINKECDVTFTEQDYYQSAITGENAKMSKYVPVGNKEYLFMYSKSDITNASICALVPKTSLMTEAIALGKTVIIWVIFSCFVVGTLGLAILYGISKNMERITKRLARVSEGDLTVDMRIKNKSEFGKIAHHISETVTNTKQLVEKVTDLSEQVNGSVKEVFDATKILQGSTEGIQNATLEIDAGVNQQAQDACQCLEKMDSLSEKIIRTESTMSEMSEVADSTKQMIFSGSGIMDQLTMQSQHTEDITDHVGNKIQMLMEKSKEIENFVSSINEISEETTLLSLNASIEAARAGDAGRGFAVVAEEIKKLADSSLKASKEIEMVVQMISSMTKETKEASFEAKKIVEMQRKTVNQTRDLFTSMNECVEKLLSNIQGMRADIKEVTSDREQTLSAIESISSVSEETAASSTMVNDTVQNQMEQVSKMVETTKELEQRTNELIEALSRFRI